MYLNAVFFHDCRMWTSELEGLRTAFEPTRLVRITWCKRTLGRRLYKNTCLRTLCYAVFEIWTFARGCERTLRRPPYKENADLQTICDAMLCYVEDMDCRRHFLTGGGGWMGTKMELTVVRKMDRSCCPNKVFMLMREMDRFCCPNRVFILCGEWIDLAVQRRCSF